MWCPGSALCVEQYHGIDLRRNWQSLGQTATQWNKPSSTLKRKCPFYQIFASGCVGSCQNDNFWCSYWGKFHKVSVHFWSKLSMVHGAPNTLQSINDSHGINTLWPGRFELNFRYIIFKLILMIDVWGISCGIALIWMPLGFTDDQSTLVQVMAWCR